MVRPADYPPPFRASDYVGEPTDPVDDRIEVGVLVVGAGPAGLSCAIRFGQLLEENADLAENLGDVPLAVIEKGKQPGSHLLSGAIVNPVSLRRLFGPQFRIEDVPGYGPVQQESVCLLTSEKSMRIPTPPPMRNHGNFIFSLSQLGRWLSSRAEELGCMILPQTAAVRLLVSAGKVVGVRTGDKGRGVDGEELARFEPGNDIVARVTVLAEGTQGHLTSVAMNHFGLLPSDPQTWELGVKEVWRVKKPLDRTIHTMGWPLRPEPRLREFGGSFIYPMGSEMVTLGMVVGLDYRDSELSVHDLLQQLKTHPMVWPILEGGQRLEWGAKTIPSGGFNSLPRNLSAPGLLICGDCAGMVNIPTLKGVHYAVEAGRLAAESAFAALKATRSGGDESRFQSALGSYDRAVRSGFIGRDLYEVRDMRQAFGRGFFLGGVISGVMAVSRGRISIGKMRSERDDAQPLTTTDRSSRYPKPDGALTFDKLSSVFLSGNKTRDDQPNHIRLAQEVPVELARMWVNLCPAHVYQIDSEPRDGLVSVKIDASNCVQCGAISARGGRLTPPEGGSGPEYSLS